MGLFSRKSSVDENSEKFYEHIRKTEEKKITNALNQNDFDTVLLIGEKLTKTYPQCSYGWETMGDAYINLDKYEDAIRCFEQSNSMQTPNLFLNYLQLGIAYEGAEKIAMAIKQYELCLNLDPNDSHGKHDFLIGSISFLKNKLDVN